MEKWTYERLAEAWADIVTQASELEGELLRLAPAPCPGARRVLFEEFLPEIAVARELVLGVLFLRSGWTPGELGAETQRRGDAPRSAS